MADLSKTRRIVAFSKQNGRHSHSKTGHKLCPKRHHSKTGPSGFRMLTVKWYQSFENQIRNRMVTKLDHFNKIKRFYDSFHVQNGLG
jgi:hypothetical protein